MQFIAQELENLFDAEHLFDEVSQAEGEVFRALENRRTVLIERDGQRYFAKSHFGVGWLEIVKNLCQLRLPVLGAENEFLALNALARIGIDSLQPVVYCSEGRNPAKRRSCIVTRALENMASLEELFQADRVTPADKRNLIPRLAAIARQLHDNGINHRDFYLCHFLLDTSDNDLRPFLIDLHRAQIRKNTPFRWQVKDIGGLFFSSFDFRLTQRDIYRFMKCYTNKSLRETLADDAPFWRAVFVRARRLYLQDHDSLPDWVSKMGPRP